MADIFISNYEQYPVVSAYIDDKLEYLSVVHNTLIGNVYLCRVENVIKNIGSAFVRFENDEYGYVSTKNLLTSAVINRKINKSSEIGTGDQIILQVETDPVKLKKAKLTSYISIPGEYSVITLGRSGVGASLKLSEEVRGSLISCVKNRYEELKDEYCDKLYDNSFGIIVRTNALDIPENELEEKLIDDIRKRLDRLGEIQKAGRSRTVFSCLHKSENNEMSFHISKAEAFLKSRKETDYRIIDSSVIYDVKRDIDKLLGNKIWLKSGAFLIVEQLESFNAFDVNTGKAISGKKDIIYKVNIEAANEIFRQIRLRNLTGMILIDFINMKNSEDTEKLCEHVKALAKKDPVHTEFIDITGLGIIELTRNKNDKSLKEILKNQKEPVDNTENEC